MAEKEKKEEVKDAKPAAGGGNKLMLVVIVLLVLVLAALGGLGAYLYLSSNKPADGTAAATEEKHEEVKKKEKKEGPPVFEKLEPFVVNLSGSNSMLQVELQAELFDEPAKAKLKDYLPKVRSAVILLLSAKTEQELQSADGKVKLKAQIKKIMNEAMDAAEEEPVENVLFTSFIIQVQ